MREGKNGLTSENENCCLIKRISNGFSNGFINGLVNWLINGLLNGHINGLVNGIFNRGIIMNRLINGIMNRLVNGITNRIMNGLTNRLINGIIDGLVCESARSSASGMPAVGYPNAAAPIKAVGTKQR